MMDAGRHGGITSAPRARSAAGSGAAPGRSWRRPSPINQRGSPARAEDAFTENTGLAVVCPITSRIHPFPTSVALPSGLVVTGEILTSHFRSIDTDVRPIRYTGITVPPAIAELVRAKLNTLITI
ncbi:MAG: type II toxin-antitoxin system PemK/MazF family toxin [Acetobacteraceae bacterium]